MTGISNKHKKTRAQAGLNSADKRVIYPAQMRRAEIGLPAQGKIPR